MDALKQLLGDVERQVAEKYADTKYSDSYVAFLDIMGMQELVGRPYTDLRKIFNAAEAGKDVYSQIQVSQRHSFICEDHLKMTIMSDSIVLSINSAINQSFLKLVGLSSYLIQQLLGVLDDPVFVRGGLVRGLLFQEGSVVFGPGLVKAYQLENERANSMRCIMSEDLENDKMIQDYLGIESCGLALDPEDGMRFIDFVRPNNRKRLSAAAKKVIGSDAKEDLKQKYRWLNRYLNGFSGA